MGGLTEKAGACMEPAWEKLVETIESDGRVSGWLSIEALGRLGAWERPVDSARRLWALKKLQDGDWDVRRSAAQALVGAARKERLGAGQGG